MESNTPIYQWLFTVEDQEQSHHQDEAENQEQVKDTSIPRIRIPLEISDSVHENEHSTSRKRASSHLEETKASSTHETIPGNGSHKRSRHSYELKPRHKTHEDRYDYKGPSAAVETQSQSRKGRSKKPRGRRHTINDDFHAINVTGNRLTLRSNTNLGIFNKGRSSSITNHHGNPPFDDTENDTKHDISHSNNKFLGVKRQLGASVTPLFTFDNAPASEISSVSSHSRSAVSHSKRRKVTKDSPSIPYTWMKTEVDTTEQSDALEQHLLSLLHVGVYPQALCPEITNTVLARRYWSLAELWELLEERKAAWPNEAGKKRASPESNMRQPVEAEPAPQVSEIIASDHLDIVNVGSVQDEMSKQSLDWNIACETARSVNDDPPEQPSVLKQQQDGPLQASGEPGCVSFEATWPSNSPDRFIDILNEDRCEPFPEESAEDAVLFPASVPEVKQPHMSDTEFYELDRLDDDDTFYRTVDAAYRAIVRPEVAAEVASGLQQLLESPELNGNEVPDSPESDTPTRQVETADSEHLATVSRDIIQDRYDERPPEPSFQHELPTSHSNDHCVSQNNDLPWLTTGYGRSQPRASTEINTRQGQPPGLSDFWRQNKLY